MHHWGCGVRSLKNSPWALWLAAIPSCSKAAGHQQDASEQDDPLPPALSGIYHDLPAAATSGWLLEGCWRNLESAHLLGQDSWVGSWLGGRLAAYNVNSRAFLSCLQQALTTLQEQQMGWMTAAANTGSPSLI